MVGCQRVCNQDFPEEPQGPATGPTPSAPTASKPLALPLWFRPDFDIRKRVVSKRAVHWIVSGYFNLKRLFLLFGLFQITSENALQDKKDWPYSGLFFDFREILTSEGHLLKITLKDS